MNRSLLHTPEGVRDMYGTEYAKKLLIQQKLHDTIRLYGYRDIQTPAFEFYEVYGSKMGTAPTSQLYKFFDREGNILALRPDFTPSCARCAAKYFMDETLPLRFTYRGSAFCDVSSLQGKLKETTQLGAELMLDGSVEAEAEMIAMMAEALLNCGLTRFSISVGDVEYFKGICSQAGLSEEVEIKLRDFVSAKNYFGAQELLEQEQVRSDCAQVLLKLADITDDAGDLAKAGRLADNERSQQAIARLEALYEVLKKYGTDKYVSFDLGLLSRYHYYTGVIFKAYTYGVGDAVATGGRYDKLLSRFGKDAPSVGFVASVDDIMEALARQNVPTEPAEEAELLFYETDSYEAALKEAIRLRKGGTAAELAAFSEDTDGIKRRAKGRNTFLVSADGTKQRVCADGGKKEGQTWTKQDT